MKNLNFEKLKKQLVDSEEWLMDRILNYAKTQGYTKYTSTLAEAWRVSIQGLTKSMIDSLAVTEEIAEFEADEKYENDPLTEFGVLEARLHRTRGIDIAMFLGLYKYYVQSYLDLLDEASYNFEEREYYTKFIQRAFDRIEVAFCAEWLGKDTEALLNELQDKNKVMTNEKNLYLTAFESMPVSVVIFDQDLKLLNLNNVAARLFFGKEVPGAYYYGLKDIDEHKFSFISDKLIKFMDSGTSSTETFSTKGETTKGLRDFEVRFKSMLDVSEKYNQIIVILNDVTQKVKHERDIKEYSRRLESSNKELERFAYVASHDLKEPIRVINSYLDLLMEDFFKDIPEEGIKYIDFVNKASKRMNRQIDDLLSLSRIKKSTMGYKLASSNNIVNSAKDNLSILLHESKANVICDLLPEVYCDPSQMVLVFQNLISNAIKFKKDLPPEIKISGNEKDDHIVLYIRDNGLGMDNEYHEKAFEMFRRFHNDKEIQGSGMGLAICKKIVELHNGKIWFESKVGEGTTFFISLPKI